MSVTAIVPEESSLTAELIRSIDQLANGIATLDSVRRTLARRLEESFDDADPICALLDEAYRDGRLSDEDYDALRGDCDRLFAEDAPTEFAGTWAPESGPGDDLSEATDAAATGYPAAAAIAGPHGVVHPGVTLRERFVLQERAPAGSMGEVYKALDRRRDEAHAEPFVAVKVISPRFARFPEAVKVLQREAALAQVLVHPHIVRVFDFDRDGDQAFITMEWLEGESLAELLTRQRYQPLLTALARRIIEQIGQALAHAHSRGVVHADVKPGNIFLTASGPAKLLDFGVARGPDEDSAEPRLQAWTRAYASCEVLSGQPADPRDDVFSLACVAYRMLAGRRAFGRYDALQAEADSRHPTRIAKLTEPEWRALQHALAFRRETRTRDMATFLSEFSHGITPEITPEVALTRLPSFPQPVETAPSRPTRRWAYVAIPVAMALMVPLLYLSTAPVGPPLQQSSASAQPVSAMLVEWSADAATLPTAPPAPPVLPSPAVEPTPEPDTAAVAPPASGLIERPAALQSPAPRSLRQEGQRMPAKPTPRPAVAATSPASSKVSTASASRTSAPVRATSAAPRDTGALPDLPVAADSAANPTAIPVPPVAAPITAPAPEPVAVPLSAMKFSRYVEPSSRAWRRRSQPGWVEIAFRVETNGETADVTVTGSSPAGLHDDAAIAAVKRWRFLPVVENGQKVERRSRVRLRFEP
jgi:TonB family protein